LGNSASALTKSRQAVNKIFRAKCMDCHSSQTEYPFYASFPLAKELIDSDVRKGRAFFNLEKNFFNIDNDKRIPQQTLSKIEYVINENSMPPIQYRLAHWDRWITAADKKTILNWIAEIKGTVIEALPERSSLELDWNKAELGFKLFHDKRLSRDNSISCASCHDLNKGGTDQKQFSRGIGGIKGHINSPTVFNSSYNFKQFWDGRADTLEAQAQGPVHNPIEMGSNWKEVIAKLKQDAALMESFKTSFGTDIIDGDMIATAIAEFERSLVTANSRFDSYLLGEQSAISFEEKEGYELFKKYNCSSCHSGAILGGQSFETMGVYMDYFADRVNGKNNLKKLALSKEDNGRFNVSNNENERHKFKVPSLRNLELTGPYFHDGNVASIEDAVRIMAEYQTGKRLNNKDILAIANFLRSLTTEDLSSFKTAYKPPELSNGESANESVKIEDPSP
jgi:cytochrome c peroxidase